MFIYIYLGQTKDSLGTVNHILNNDDLSMILHAGDLSYADCHGNLWDTYGEMIGTYIYICMCVCTCVCTFICKCKCVYNIFFICG